MNLTAPNPVTNAEYTAKRSGRVLHRPTLIPTPLFGFKAVYGAELVDTLLGSQRVSSEKLRRQRLRVRIPRPRGRAARVDLTLPVRLWIDTDVGDNPDDAVALLVAAAHPDVESGGCQHHGRADRMAG